MKEKEGGVVFKLNLKKTFDHVTIELIMHCFTSSNLSIL